MIILEGNLTNKVIHGRNGDFSVGTFKNGLGTFSVRSTILDQYEEGEFEVQLAVTRIYPRSYTVESTQVVVIETVLDIDSMQVLKGEVKATEPVQMEPDASIDESTQEGAVQRADKPEPVKSKPAAKTDSNEDPAKLFGHLWPLGAQIKLDTTVNRAVFIKQKTYLGNNGYELDLKTQMWEKKAA